MKKQFLFLFISALMLQTNAQTISTFETLDLPADSFWNGKYNVPAKGFSNGNAFFTNTWDTSFGGYWAEGFAYSNRKDSTTAGFGNLYSAIAGAGYNGSATYAVGQQHAVIRVTGAAKGKEVMGMYVTNTTYPYLSMANGDAFSKKFGGTSGNDSDYFKMTIEGWFNGSKVSAKVDFFLADYTGPNNTQDYIVKNWTWVNLLPLGNIDSLQINLSSSDTGAFGINTPLFYAIDNFTTRDAATGIVTIQHADHLLAYPNPFVNTLNLQNSSPDAMEVKVFNSNGQETTKLVLAQNEKLQLATDTWPAGIYFVHTMQQGNKTTRKIVKY